MPPAGFEPTIPACEWPRTHALDRAAIGTGKQKSLASISFPDAMKSGESAQNYQELSVILFSILLKVSTGDFPPVFWRYGHVGRGLGVGVGVDSHRWYVIHFTAPCVNISAWNNRVGMCKWFAEMTRLQIHGNFVWDCEAWRMGTYWRLRCAEHTT